MLSIFILAVMIYGIIWLIKDGRDFCQDLEKVAKGKKTKKYFTEFNKKKKK